MAKWNLVAMGQAPPEQTEDQPAKVRLSGSGNYINGERPGIVNIHIPGGLFWLLGAE